MSLLSHCSTYVAYNFCQNFWGEFVIYNRFWLYIRGELQGSCLIMVEFRFYDSDYFILMLIHCLYQSWTSPPNFDTNHTIYMYVIHMIWLKFCHTFWRANLDPSSGKISFDWYTISLTWRWYSKSLNAIQFSNGSIYESLSLFLYEWSYTYTCNWYKQL